jgi:hypothetical protein
VTADYPQNQHGHCNVPFRYSENAKLAPFVSEDRLQGLQVRRASPMTAFLFKGL